MAEKYKAVFSLGITVTLFAFLAIIAKSLVADTPSVIVLFLRMVFAFFAFLPFLLKSKVWRKKHFKDLIFTSVFSGINVTLFMTGIEFTSASVSQLIYAAMPVLTILSGLILFNQKFSKTRVTGVVIGLLGIVFIIFRSAVEMGETITGSLSGNLLITIAMLSWLTYVLRSKKLSAYFRPVEIGSVSVTVGLIISILLLAIRLLINQTVPALSLPLLLGALYMGVLGTFITYILLQYAIKILSPLTVNLTAYIQPIITTFLAVIILGEKLTVNFIIGSLFVFMGIFLTVTMEFINR
ncbi:hypothetical protein A3D05_00900 [Candidatus Gottesmanbacteria bacterium RIFCSPHIGHO2_02_FULL_40_24]|uniref:EamA domain-containing protein n=1 Tax=Candidatus Gottesmanbacteria bacterium RIFCSPHIGHO2_01_FULL_40_15 TaxID=1798376 RepID=A0A1F5Z0N7_9BACT|nr:MAG: hypothetical protein A2777_05170 [Candidatus Gottesmanbacteria bacterium RIFCSPHIGHO2_01_FULL_40_15]OGG18295.1 MAG: hypothetical protein A3D05_00900 [Candidatus Gottesmanbacteria bacterium RIFCSPHIGHO2_02_FULL_40_24]OGG22462.1 MAG: hypothetical protein A3B48_04250 [Candidatus Gottesmanbacteria bacterium RIFCSPLOWO2_01_FULL_40_10]OGG24853.1 MAG: hypothetical protein A3E42_01985 [Candidatus Gottesmanbacteria bacterium RIFCSPHIGHO2_12_FULL_40_13]OGG32164.1 MAG: hypothetical protein A3I80_0